LAYYVGWIHARLIGLLHQEMEQQEMGCKGYQVPLKFLDGSTQRSAHL